MRLSFQAELNYGQRIWDKSQGYYDYLRRRCSPDMRIGLRGSFLKGLPQFTDTLLLLAGVRATEKARNFFNNKFGDSSAFTPNVYERSLFLDLEKESIDQYPRYWLDIASSVGVHIPQKFVVGSRIPDCLILTRTYSNKPIAIEVDGLVHGNSQKIEKDLQFEAIASKLGLGTLRIDNSLLSEYEFNLARPVRMTANSPALTLLKRDLNPLENDQYQKVHSVFRRLCLAACAVWLSPEELDSLAVQCNLKDFQSRQGYVHAFQNESLARPYRSSKYQEIHLPATEQFARKK